MRRYVFACLIAACAALTPTLASAGDEEIAQYIIEKLSKQQDAGQLKNFDLDLHVEGGVVWFKGHVMTADQKQLVLRTAQSGQNLGVTRIVDEIDVQAQEQAVAQSNASSRRGYNRPAETEVVVQDRNVMQTGSQPRVTEVQPVQHNQQLAPVPNQSGRSIYRAQPVAQAPTAVSARPVGTGSRAPLASAPAAGYQQPAMMVQGGAPAYLPTAGGRPVSAHYDQPNMPNHAWPAYAAHPNYSAVTYPTQYSPTAWPYIGPFYPYPQVPLGWRKVTLEWDDGWWYLDFHQR